MSQTQIIALIGMAGAGKSTIGKILAQRIDGAFYDSDREITAISGLSPSEIFHYYGEKEFRRLELGVIDRLSQTNEVAVLSTGGGCVSVPDIRDMLRYRTFTIYLNVSEENLWARLKNATDRRPMFRGINPRQKLHELLSQRRPYYECAELTVSGDHCSPYAIVEDIENELPPCFKRKGNNKGDK